MDMRKDKIRVIKKVQIMHNEDADNGIDEGGGARGKSGMAFGRGGICPKS